MRKLPLSYHCDRRWHEMSGENTVVRTCADCGCDVVNLSALDEATARQLLEQQTHEACVRYRRQDNRILFARRAPITAVAAAAAVLLVAAPGGADTKTPPPPPRKRERAAPKKRAKAPEKRPDPDAEDDGKILPPRF